MELETAHGHVVDWEIGQENHLTVAVCTAMGHRVSGYLSFP